MIEALENRVLFVNYDGTLDDDVRVLLTPNMTLQGVSRAEVRDGTLFVTGTHKADRLTIRRNDSADVKVIDGNEMPDGYPQAVRPTPGSLIEILGGGYVYAAPASAVSRIVIGGGAGNDWLIVARDTGVRTTISGGDGNDQLEAGRRWDVLNGNAGDDTLVPPRDLTDSLSHYRGNAGTDTIVVNRTNVFATSELGLEHLWYKGKRLPVDVR